MNDPKKIAGGRATEAGMGFQAAVVTWFAAQYLADTPIGTQFGLPSSVRIVGLQCETGDALDDLVVRLDCGGAIYIQCKTRPSLTKSADSLLAKSLDQVVGLYVQLGRATLAATSNTTLLAVAQDAARSLDTLESACRMFDMGGAWASVIEQVPNEKRDALLLFEAHIRRAWASRSKAPLTDDDLVAMAHLFRIHRFAEDGTSATWRDASHLLGRRVFGSDPAGEAPMTTLMALSRKLIRTGAPVDRAGLLRVLRAEGHSDVSAPGYDKDIAALRAYSDYERKRLSKHMRLPLGEGIPIYRDCLDPLLTAVEQGSLLVTGEPGAGKTGLLLALAERRAKGPGPLVFLSVERFAGFNKQSDFRAELKLDFDPIEVLAAWPGAGPGALIIDALDASRGGPSEPVIAAFIAEAVEKLGARWSIVASIRSFDLRNGQRFRDIMPGAPPNENFIEKGMDKVRHFYVPRLSSDELSRVASVSPKLREMEEVAPQKLRDLLHNIFNLSLAAELLEAGVEAQSIRTVSTQAELISRYEDVRLTSHALRLAAKAAVTLMVRRRQLTVRAIDIENDAVDEVRKAGVLVAAGDSVAFAHHVLFDHIAGRFYLAWDDINALREQISGDLSIGLLLGPALRFALEQVWQGDTAGRNNTWQFLADMMTASEPNPVVASIALRTAAERVELPTDVDGLCAMLLSAGDVRATGKLLSQLARFVGMSIAERGCLSAQASLSWAAVARAAATGGDRYFLDAARILLMTLAEKADFSDDNTMAMFGEAARALLRSAWSLEHEHPSLAASAIGFVSKSYGSDPAASCALLERILDDRFDEHSAQEAPWLAEGVPDIIPHDPVFVARIYATVFARDVTDESKTWIGGSASRILPLTSTRKQDYQQARWRLNESLKSFLNADAISGTAAVIGAVRGLATEKRRGREVPPEPTVLNIGGQSVEVVDDVLSLEDWRQQDTRQEKPLAVFAEFLRSCSSHVFRNVVTTTLELPANAAIWARILGVAAERVGVADDVLWPLASNPHFIALQGLARDAVIFLAAAYGAQPPESRAAFEMSAVADLPFPHGREARWWRAMLGRFLSVVPQTQLATQEMKALRAEMEAAGDLTGNPPFVSMTVGWSSNENIVDSILRSDGADLERSPDREIRAASRKVEDHVKVSGEAVDAAILAALWHDIVELVETLDAAAVANPHTQLVRSGWGAVCNGVELITKSAAYAPGGDGLPDLSTLLALIDRLSASPYPEVTDQPSDHMGWGNWDVRVYAASSLVALAPRFAGERADIVDRMQTCLHDPTPTVRLQVAQALNVLWNVAPDRMWSLMTEVVEQETHEGILSFFIGGPMWPLSRKHPDRGASLLSRILERGWATATVEERRGRDRDAEAAGNLAAFLYVSKDQPEAWRWIERWSADLRRGEPYLTSMLHSLRQVFFLPYGEAPKPNDLDMGRRGRRLLDVVVGAAAAAIVEARPHLLGAPEQAVVDAWQPLYVAAHHLIDNVCNQIYFGSGAYRSQGEADNRPGLTTSSDKQRFLADYGVVLDAVATHAQARTVQSLIELLAYLVEGNPTAVFDRIANILLGPAAEDGYQFESLGLNSLVKLIRRYLADYRDMFADGDRRQKLVEVLELFSSAGWPDALKLLFELPDLLR